MNPLYGRASEPPTASVRGGYALVMSALSDACDADGCKLTVRPLGRLGWLVEAVFNLRHIDTVLNSCAGKIRCEIRTLNGFGYCSFFATKILLSPRERSLFGGFQ